jgi:hypothetical protein
MISFAAEAHRGGTMKRHKRTAVITKEDLYITGMFALNLYSDFLTTTGDWHGNIWNGITMFPSKDVSTGGGQGDINTVMIWGDYGIYEGKRYLLNKKIQVESENVFVANHIRAVLDMVYKGIKKYGMIWEVDNASVEYLGNEASKQEMLGASKEILPFLNKKELSVYKKWYKHEKRVRFKKSEWFFFGE